MSKRYFNVVNPDVVVAEFGADAFRLYEMFLGPVEDSKPWDTRNMKGTFRFVNRFWSLFFDKGEWIANDESEPTREELRALHACIKRVSEDIERFSFNTCVPQFMICTDELKRLNCRKKSVLETFLRLVAPFAPFVTEELWQQAGNSGSIHHAEYPTHNESYLTQDEFEYPLCINGKKRTTFVLPANITKLDDVEKFIKEQDLSKWLEQDKGVSKTIFVYKRMINLIVSDKQELTNNYIIFLKESVRQLKEGKEGKEGKEDLTYDEVLSFYRYQYPKSFNNNQFNQSSMQKFRVDNFVDLKNRGQYYVKTYWEVDKDNKYHSIDGLVENNRKEGDPDYYALTKSFIEFLRKTADSGADLIQKYEERMKAEDLDSSEEKDIFLD
jgi:isoleucyl-tRNA synthetase